MKIVVDNAIPFIKGILEPYAEVLYLDGKAISPADVADADALIVRTRTRCDAALLEGSAVKQVVTATIGFDHIDLGYCRDHGIGVATSAGCNARGVLQWVGAALAHLSQRHGFTPSERTLGVVGVGHVGSLVAEYAAAWGFRVVCCDPPRQQREGDLGFVGFGQLLREADIVTFHVPLDASTRHMLDGNTLRLLRPGSIVINTSRGEVIDTEALCRSGHPYALDVWENEPEISRDLLERAEISTPHIAGYSLQGKANASSMAVNTIADRFGLPLCGWYPEGVGKSVPKEIGWEEMSRSIAAYCDIEGESLALKRHPEEFERMRNSYAYRQEYF